MYSVDPRFECRLGHNKHLDRELSCQFHLSEKCRNDSEISPNCLPLQPSGLINVISLSSNIMPFGDCPVIKKIMYNNTV